MILPLSLGHRARPVRTVSVSGSTVTVDDTPGSWFRCQLFASTGTDLRNEDESPRGSLPRERVWYVTRGLSPAPDLNPSDRLEVQAHGAEATWEVVSEPRTLRHGTDIVGYEAELIRLTDLFEHTASVNDPGVVAAVTDMPLSLWPLADPRRSTQGSHEEFAGDAPPEFYSDLNVPNRFLTQGTRTFRITAAILHLTVPHVELRLNRTTSS